MIGPDTEQQAVMRALVEASDGTFCERCRCCEEFPVECWDCGGEGYHEDDEWDGAPGDEVTCSTCSGKGGWLACDCDADGQHTRTATRPGEGEP